MKKIPGNVSVKANYLYNMFYEVLLLLVPLITTPYVSRVLEADGIGIYSYTLSIVTYFGLAGKLGMPTYGQLQVSVMREDKTETSYLFWEIMIVKFISTGICTIAYLFVIVSSNTYQVYFALLLIYMLSCALDFTWFLQGLEQFKKIVFRNLIVKILSVALIFLCVKEKNDLWKYFIIIQGSVLIGNILIIPQIRQYLVKVEFSKFRIFRHIRPGFMYFIPTIATTIYLSLDKSMIGWITHSAFENGFYEQAHKIEQVVVTVVTSLSTVTMPRMAYLFKSGNEADAKNKIVNSMKFILCVSIPMAFGMIGVSKILIPWFLGDGYEKCVMLLRIFSVLIIVVGLNNAVGKQVLMAIGKQKEYNYSVILGAIINAILNSILIPLWASVGAAVASVVAETVVLLIFIRAGKEYISVKQIIMNAKNYMAAGLIMCTTLLLLNKKTMIPASFKGVAGEIILGIFEYFIIVLICRDRFVMQQIRLLIRSARKK